MYHYKYIHIVYKKNKSFIVNISLYSDIVIVHLWFSQKGFHVKFISLIPIFCAYLQQVV